jgi:hypothetical protein
MAIGRLDERHIDRPGGRVAPDRNREQPLADSQGKGPNEGHARDNRFHEWAVGAFEEARQPWRVERPR